MGAFHYSMYGGSLEVGSALVAAGANVAAEDKTGRTALHLAAVKGHVEVAKWLLEEQGLDLKATTGVR